MQATMQAEASPVQPTKSVTRFISGVEDNPEEQPASLGEPFSTARYTHLGNHLLHNLLDRRPLLFLFPKDQPESPNE